MTPTAEEMRKISDNPYLRAETNYLNELEMINLQMESAAKRNEYKIFIDANHASREFITVIRDYYTQKGYRVTVENSAKNETFLVIDWSEQPDEDGSGY